MVGACVSIFGKRTSVDSGSVSHNFWRFQRLPSSQTGTHGSEVRASPTHRSGSSPLRGLLLTWPHLRPGAGAHARGRGEHRLGGSPPLFPPRGGLRRGLRRRARSGAGPARFPVWLSREAGPRSRRSPSPPVPPGLRLQRQPGSGLGGGGGASASSPRPAALLCPGPQRPRPRRPGAGLGRGLSSGIVSAPPAPGPPPMGPG